LGESERATSSNKDGVSREVNFDLSGGKVGVNSEFTGEQKLEWWENLSSDWFNDVVQGKSLILRVHHSEHSGSVKRSKWSVFREDSPYIESSVLASVVVVGKDRLNWDVDGSNSDVRSIGFQPFDTKVVNGVFAGIHLELELEIETIRSIGESLGHINSQVISGGSSVGRGSSVNVGNYWFAWVNSVFNSWGGEWLKSKFEGRDSKEWHLENS